MSEDIKDLVIGRWSSIFEQLGVDVGDGRHGTCPLCGTPGRSKPFRFDDLNGTGTWICTYCGAGDGWSLLQRKFALEFPDAVNEIKKIINQCEVRKGGSESVASPERLRELFLNSSPLRNGDFVSWYLRNRGLNTFPNTLRSSKKCYEPETRKFRNAMLAIFHSHENQAITIHRTYLDENGNKASDIEEARRIMPSLKKMAGGAVRLFECTEVLGVAEGIETAIAANELFRIPVWPTLTAQLLETFIPPDGVKSLFVFGDNDQNYHGQKAAYSLAHRVNHLNVEVIIPEKKNSDWLDVLNLKLNKI